MFASAAPWLVVLSLVAQGQVSRDSRPLPPTGTASLAGRVMTSDEAPLPVRRARVLVTRTDGAVERSVLTDGEGRFAVTALPAGRYNVSATKAGWLRASFGATRPGRPGTQIALAATQPIADLALTMARGGVITGTVTDQLGRPVRGVLVRLLQFRFERGERILGQASVAAGSTGEVTDDRGEYRLYGLPPGEYAVGAAPADEGHGATRLMGGGTAGYVPVFYPGTTAALDAGRVVVKSGEETSGINLPLQYVRTARIAGTIVGFNDAEAQNLRVTLTPHARVPLSAASGSDFDATTILRQVTPSGPDRRFSFSGVPPGRYAVMARAFERPVPQAGQSYASAISGVTTQWGMADLLVDGTDMSDVVLSLQEGLTVAGRIQLEGAAAMTPVPTLSRIHVSLNHSGGVGAGASVGFPSTYTNASGEFVIKGVVPGKYRLSAAYGGDLASGWSVRTAMDKDRDLMDFPLDLSGGENVTGIAIVMTRAVQRVSGLIQNEDGVPTPGLTVVLFPADRTLWLSGRRTRTARSGQDGRYELSGVPAGEYRIAAVTDMDASETHDPAFLEALLPASIAITLADGERKVQGLRVAR
jgi:uncharacterized protein (DUF2141 family)